MKIKLLLLSFLLPVLLTTCTTDEGPLPTEKIMKKAYRTAKKQDKNVFVMWDASWCGWCHRLDSLMHHPDIQALFNRNFVIVNLIVKESEKNKNLENPGGLEMLTQYHGDKSGIPFWVILDKDGNLIADSFMRPNGAVTGEPGENCGCPAQENELRYWKRALHATTDLNDAELNKITDLFKL